MNEPTLRARVYALAAFVMLGILSLQLVIAPSYACPIFPAAGLALALVLMLMSGNRQWPSVWVGALVVGGYDTYCHGDMGWGDALVVLATACGVVLQAWAGAWLIRRWLPQRWQNLEGLGDVLTFLALGGPLSCVISATVGVVSLYFAGRVPVADAPWMWLTWWCGDLFGVWMFAPLALAFLNRQDALWKGRLITIGGVVLVSVSVVLAFFMSMSKADREEYSEEISYKASNVRHHIEMRLIAYKEMLATLCHLIEVTPHLSREQFEYFTHQTLKDNTDQLALSFNTYVQHANRKAFEREQGQRLALPGFKITQRDAQSHLVPAAVRPSYVAVTYIAPLQANRSALGYDIYSDPTRADAIERALRLGQPTITAPITLVQNQKVGMLVLYPAYQRSTKPLKPNHPSGLLGFAVGVLNVAEMAERAQTTVGHSIEPGIVFKLSDPAAPPGQRLLFQSGPDKPPPQMHLVWQGSISVFDRTWDLVVFPNRQWLDEHPAWKTWVISAAGLLLASMLQVLILVSTGRVALVRREVLEKTAELQRTTDTMHMCSQQVRNVIDNIDDPVFLKDDQGKFVLVNVALARLYNTTPAAMIGRRSDDLGVSVTFADGFFQGEQAALFNGEKLIVVEDSQDRVSGEVRHYKSIKTPMTDSHGRPQMLVVAHDITEIVCGHKQVAESEQRLQDVMNITQEAVWDWHVPSGRVLHNRQWYEVLGFQIGEITDTVDVFASFIHKDDKPGVMQRIDALLQGDTDSYQSEHRMVGKQGTIWVQDRGGVVERDKQGHIIRVVGSFTDITERHLAQDKIATLLSEQQAILQSDVVGLLITTKNRNILWATPSLLNALGYDWIELEGRGTRLIFQSEEAFLALGEAAYPVILAHQKFRTQVQFRHKNGSLCWFDLAGTIFGEHSDQVLWSCVDISAQKMAEAKLMEAQQEALAANAAKSQFLATMSHEVRTPMNGILGMAQLLVLPQLQDDKRVQFALTIINSGHTLLSLLNDILDLSKVEAGKLKLESIAFAVDSIVSDIRALFAETANAKGLKLESVWQGPAGPCYLGDPYRLRQMLSNLISNAIKFTASGFVRIVACEIERQSQHAVLEFSVLDSGIGITNEQQARLFQAFSQADSSTTRQFGGSGLGLSIVLRLAQLMGGEVGIDSKHGQGSRFWFRVRVLLQTDVQDLPQMTAELGAVSVKDLKGAVLIAEDNPVNRMVIMAMLDELDCSGLTVTVVENVQQARDFITEGGAPDLVLMDVQMPVMGGLESTEKIRLWEADHGKPHATIVALTANAFEEDRKKCLAAGMDDFLVKPIDMEKLQATLVCWLSRFQ